MYANSRSAFRYAIPSREKFLWKLLSRLLHLWPTRRLMRFYPRLIKER
ncbi:hypothetical protein COSO111634_26820 [Corallococcus soli]